MYSAARIWSIGIRSGNLQALSVGVGCRCCFVTQKCSKEVYDVQKEGIL